MSSPSDGRELIASFVPDLEQIAHIHGQRSALNQREITVNEGTDLGKPLESARFGTDKLWLQEESPTPAPSGS